MSKSGAPSASASASVSASSPSSNDPHSLPPHVKGLVQRYLAVSLPTITLTPEVIDILDRSEVLIPSRIQVTMRWWREDAACSLAVFPKLNSPLPVAVEKRQSILRHRQQQEKQRMLLQKLQLQQQLQQQQQQQQLQQLPHQRSHDAMPSGSSARPLTPAKAQGQAQQAQQKAQTQPPPRSSTPSFLKRPWSGARLLSVFRKPKTKAGSNPASSADPRDSPTPTPSHHELGVGGGGGGGDPQSETKPLPSLPEAAYPITVAYPVRCTLDQLQRYFLEMSTLTLEIQITSQLSAIATVTSLTDLFRNINGTFSGVFSFSTILQNDDPRLKAERLFQNKVVLGMVVFQSWLQDTSDVNDSEDESDSISTNSMLAMLASNSPGGVPHLPNHTYHRQHIPPAQQPRPGQPRIEQQQIPPLAPYLHPSQQPRHHQPLVPPHLQPSREFEHRSQGVPHRQDSTQYPIPHQHIPQQQLQPQTQRQRPLPLHIVIPSRAQPAPAQPLQPSHPAHTRPVDREGYGHRISMHYDDEHHYNGGAGGHRGVLQRPQQGNVPAPVNTSTPYRQEGHLHHQQRLPREEFQQPPRERLSHSGRHHERQSAAEAATGGGAARIQSRYPDVRIPTPNAGPSGGEPSLRQQYQQHQHRYQPQHPPQHQNQNHRLQQQHQQYPHHYYRQDPHRASIDESLRYDDRRRSDDTNLTNLYSQSARSRPRASATAAAIGRLDSVLARGEDLLHGMRTSLALDPDEVRGMSARNTRSSRALREDMDDERHMPYHEVLPYWPSKSRFSLEMSIPTAYLTSHGLLKGSKQKKHSSMPTTSGSSRDPPSSSGGGDRDGKGPRREWDRSEAGSRTPQQQQYPQQQRQSQSASPYQHQHQQQGQPGPSSQYPLPQKERRDRGKQPWVDPDPDPGPHSSTGPSSTLHPLRRSGRPIQSEKVSSRPDLERLRLAQEESIRPRYQSFQNNSGVAGASGVNNSTSPRDKYQQQQQQRHQGYGQQQDQQSPYGQQRQQQQQQQQQQRRGNDQQSSDWATARDQRSPQPRKSRSYPPPSSSDSQPERRGREGGGRGGAAGGGGGEHRSGRGRRLSSNDRLQLRMNPRAGDMLNYIPELFPSRSMSALLVPEYFSSMESSSGAGSGGSFSTGNSSSFGTEDDDRYGYRFGAGGGDMMGGRQSRLQKRPHRATYRHHPNADGQQQAKRHQSHRYFNQEPHHRQQEQQEQQQQQQSKNKKSKGNRVHPQHFNFKVQCQLQLTPEVMAACMVENISIEVWKLNSKRQTMIELGSAKLPLHKVLSRIMHKTATMSTMASGLPPLQPREQSRPHRGMGFGATRMGGSSQRYASAGGPPRHMGGANAGYKDGWRLEPTVYDIRSRQGTIVGQLDADVWIYPRSRSDSMVSAAA